MGKDYNINQNNDTLRINGGGYILVNLYKRHIFLE